MGQAPLGSLSDASQVLPTGSWVTVPGALAQQDVARLLCFPVREELLRHHWVEEETRPSPGSSGSAVPGRAAG